MWLIVGKISIKAEWWDAALVLHHFSQSDRPETRRQNLRYTQRSHFPQLQQEQKEGIIYWVDKANICD